MVFEFLKKQREQHKREGETLDRDLGVKTDFMNDWMQEWKK